MADDLSNALGRPLPDGIVPQDIVARTEKRWVLLMVGMLLIMMAVIEFITLIESDDVASHSSCALPGRFSL